MAKPVPAFLSLKSEYVLNLIPYQYADNQYLEGKNITGKTADQAVFR